MQIQYWISLPRQFHLCKLQNWVFLFNLLFHLSQILQWRSTFIDFLLSRGVSFFQRRFRGNAYTVGKNKTDIWEFFMKKLFIKTCRNFFSYFWYKKKWNFLFVVNNAYIFSYVQRFVVCSTRCISLKQKTDCTRFCKKKSKFKKWNFEQKITIFTEKKRFACVIKVI